jgi:hypothetical protein
LNVVTPYAVNDTIPGDASVAVVERFEVGDMSLSPDVSRVVLCGMDRVRGADCSPNRRSGGGSWLVVASAPQLGGTATLVEAFGVNVAGGGEPVERLGDVLGAAVAAE